MNVPPLAQQLLVAGSTHLAALSAGGVVAYPGVLLQQLKSNDTTIHLDLDNGSWIGSVHGLAGMPSFLMPFLMQYRGRKFAFILTCLLIIIGWAITNVAQSITTLIIGECFHGLGGHSLVAISFLSISEMVQPKYRNICSLAYGTFLAFGITLVGIIGRYLHWKTTGMIMCCPMIVALIIGCTWPESPSWLAYKGDFEDCEKTFKRLRGTDDESMKELNALLNSYKKTVLIKPARKQWYRDLLNTITRKDFYLPSMHTCVLLSVFYWTGGVVIIIYSSDIILKTTGKKNDNIKLILDSLYFIGYFVTTLLCRYCKIKKVLLFSMLNAAIFMMLAAVVTYLQSAGIILQESMWGAYCIIGFMLFFGLGSNVIGFTVGPELMPVKHRGLGGGLIVIYTCIFHSSTLKSFPYLCEYIQMWGAFLIYCVYTFLAALVIWTFVPETKNRTLQEIEEYYNLGYFKEIRYANGKEHQSFLKTEGN